MVSSGTLQWVERPQPVEIPKKFAKALSTSPKTSPQQSQSYQSASVCVLLSPSSLQGIKLEFSTPTWNNQYQPGHPRPKSDCWSSQLLLWIKSLDPKGENGRKVDQIGQASHLIGSNALLTIWPKKTHRNEAILKFMIPYKVQNIFEPKTHISKSFSNTFTQTSSFLSWIKVGQPHQKYVLWWSSPIRQASAHQWSETWPGSGSAWRCNLATYLWASSINQGMTTMSLAGSPTPNSHSKK